MTPLNALLLLVLTIDDNIFSNIFTILVIDYEFDLFNLELNLFLRNLISLLSLGRVQLIIILVDVPCLLYFSKEVSWFNVIFRYLYLIKCRSYYLLVLMILKFIIIIWALLVKQLIFMFIHIVYVFMFMLVIILLLLYLTFFTIQSFNWILFMYLDLDVDKRWIIVTHSWMIIIRCEFPPYFNLLWFETILLKILNIVITCLWKVFSHFIIVTILY